MAKEWVPVIISAFDVDYTCGGEDFEFDIPLYCLVEVSDEAETPD